MAELWRRLPAPAPWLALLLLGPPGAAIAAYLTYSHLADEPTVCAGFASCGLVQSSEYSEIAGIPVALMGLLYFIAMPLLALVRVTSGRDRGAWVAPVAVTAALAATGFVAYLTLVEIFVLSAICLWCVSLAALTVASLAVAVWAAAYG